MFAFCWRQLYSVGETPMENCAMDSVVTVHPLSEDPTAAWEELSKTQKCTLLPVKYPKEPPQPDHVRVVCMSDTHSEDERFNFSVPAGDIFIHAGDFTMWSQIGEVIQFNEWMRSLPHKHKIVIAGNHELSFDDDCILFSGYLRDGVKTVNDMWRMLANVTYLQDSAVTLYGLKIYGSPWQPEHGGLAFNLPRGEKLLSKWEQIPEDTDILITHGPPVGHGDRLDGRRRVGCVELLSTIQKRVKPRYHVFGHIHEGYGMSTDGVTTFINSATCDRNYVAKNLPIVFDIKIKSDKEGPTV